MTRARARRRPEAREARGEAAWKELRDGLEAALRELRKALQDAKDEVELTET
jgi:hypothetical protein